MACKNVKSIATSRRKKYSRKRLLRQNSAIRWCFCYNLLLAVVHTGGAVWWPFFWLFHFSSDFGYFYSLNVSFRAISNKAQIRTECMHKIAINSSNAYVNGLTDGPGRIRCMKNSLIFLAEKGFFQIQNFEPALHDAEPRPRPRQVLRCRHAAGSLRCRVTPSSKTSVSRVVHQASLSLSNCSESHETSSTQKGPSDANGSCWMLLSRCISFRAR